MKHINKEVSIVIPTKNNGDILEKCLNLDYLKDKYEVIIVDDILPNDVKVYN